jgi:hypothetical protein
VLLYAALVVHADEVVHCTGFLTSNGVCVGSESNTAPSTFDCTGQECWYVKRSRR